MSIHNHQTQYKEKSFCIIMYRIVLLRQLLVILQIKRILFVFTR